MFNKFVNFKKLSTENIFIFILFADHLFEYFHVENITNVGVMRANLDSLIKNNCRLEHQVSKNVLILPETRNISSVIMIMKIL
jgi:hypothetical protein